MIAVAGEIALGSRAPVPGVELEAGDYVLGHLAGQAAFARDEAEGVEGGVGGRQSLERAFGEQADRGHAPLGAFLLAERSAQFLCIGKVVAPATPGI